MRSRKQRLSWLKLFCLCTVLHAARMANASEYHGQVLFGGVPVPGATVTVTQGAIHFTTVTDQQGLYEFAEIVDGNWKIQIAMRGFSTLDGEVAVAPSMPQGAWELKMLGLQQMLADTQVTKPVSKPLQTRSPGEADAVKKENTPKQDEAGVPEAPRPPDAVAERSADGFLINGSVNNAATSQFSLAQGFGNRRPGAKGLYTGGIGAIIDNSSFDARPYSFTGSSIPKASYSRVTALVTLGGPLNIPHLMPRGPNFFIGYQWTRGSNATTLPGLVPTDAERNGDLSGLLNAQGQPITIFNPTTGLPFSGAIPVSPQAQALLKLYPLPNLLGSPGYNYQTQVLNSTHTDVLQSRLNKSIGHRDQLYGTFGFQSSRTNSASLFNFRDTTNTLGIDTSVNWSHRWFHQVFVNTGYHFTRQRTEVQPEFANREDVSRNAGINGNSQSPSDWGPPGLTFSNSGIYSLNDAQSAFNRNRTDALSVEVTTSHGRHYVTFGGDFRRQEFNVFSQVNPRGLFTFTGAATQGAASTSTTSGSDFADFLLGVPDASAIAFGNADKYFRQSVYDAYVTDDWRLRPELTIKVGARWDYGAPISELFGRLVNLDISPGFGAVRPVLGSSPQGSLTGEKYPSSLVRPDKRGFQPRVGISWRPFPASTMVVRAGYGINDDTSVYLSSAQTMAQQSPLSKSVSVANSAACPLTLANGFFNCPSTTANTFAIDPNLHVGYVQTWQLAIQRDMPAALVMTATYLGIKGTHGMQQFLPNTYPIGAINPCPACPVGFVYETSGGNSTRQAAQLQLRRRLRSGFTATLQYTYAKAIDDDSQLGGQGHVVSTTSTTGASQPAAAATVAQNWLDLRAERGLSTFDQRHLLTVQLQYTTGMGLHGGTLLGGWRGTLLKEWTVLSQISTGSGLPETPAYSAIVPGTAFTTIRPNLTGQPIHQISAGRYLNAAAFSAPTPGQWGNARRDSITGPNQFSLDASLARTFRLHEPFSLDVRLDATNLLNHIVFTTWNTTVNSTTFGQPVATNPSRSLQLTGRLRF